jgi:hypothetical protein
LFFAVDGRDLPTGLPDDVGRIPLPLLQAQ